jgi:hypothetical protein
MLFHVTYTCFSQTIAKVDILLKSSFLVIGMHACAVNCKDRCDIIKGFGNKSIQEPSILSPGCKGMLVFMVAVIHPCGIPASMSHESA